MARILNTIREALVLAMIERTCVTHLPVCLLDDTGQRAGIQPFIYGGS